MISVILLIAVLAIVMYILYINGFLIMNSKRAAMYAGRLGGKKASFISCTGYTKRVIRIRESENYRFALKTDLSKGDVWVELHEAGGGEILRLDSQVQSRDAFLEKGKRYYLVVRFQAASGKYELDWSEYYG